MANPFKALSLTILIAILLYLSSCRAQVQQPKGDPKATEVWEPVPRLVTPGIESAPPSDAIILFSGNDLSEWQHADGSAAKWSVAEGAFTVVADTGDIHTKRAFGDCQLHVEWRTPAKVEGEGQGRGNSGVYLQQRYEVQVLDSYNNPTYSNGQTASIYKQYIPLVNASRKPGEWQSYDIVFRAPRFGKSGVLTPAYITVIHNGVLVQDHAELKGSTTYIGQPSYDKHDLKQPLALQDHGNPVSYRNIWIREL
jgi:3-keto-disaccharide hydrolase